MLIKQTPSRRNILLIVVAFFFIFFGFDGAIQYLVASYAKEGIAHLAFNSQIILYITFAFSNIYSAKLIKPFGLKYSMIVGVFVYFLYIFSLLTKSALFIYPSAVLVGIGAALLWVSSRQMITINSTKVELGKYLSWHFSSFMLGTLLGALAGAALIGQISFSALYIFFSIAILVSLPILLAIKGSKDVLPPTKFDPGYVLKKHIVLLAPLVFSATFLSAQAQNGLSIVLLSRFGLTSIGTFAILFESTIVVGSFLVGLLSVRLKEERILFTLALIGITGTILFLLGVNYLVVALSAFLMGFFVSSTHTQVLNLVRQIIDTDEYVYVIGAFQVYQCLGVLTALLSAKYIDTAISFLPGVVGLLLSFPLLWMYKKKYLC